MKRAHNLAVLLSLFALAPSCVQAQPTEPAKHFTNGIGMKFVWIRAGTFLMGSPNSEYGREQNETQHKVVLSNGFYMAIHAVTQEEWQAVMGSNPSFFKGKNLPVDSVSWDDCDEFLQKLIQKEGHAYRLPTEAEWEFACRAGTTTPFHFGQTISTDQANFNGDLPYQTGRLGMARNKTTPVGSFPGNSWGLYDMHGNVWQWCLDWYGEYPAKMAEDPNNTLSKHLPRAPDFIQQLSSTTFAERQSATNALKDIGLPALPLLRRAASKPPDLETQRRLDQLVADIAKRGGGRVLRGGSFNYQASYMRSAYRFRLVPDFRPYNVGFRVVLPLTTASKAG